jgi:Ni/Fe-hydrogenase subunit HybB-like protein
MVVAGRRIEVWILWALVVVGLGYTVVRFTVSLGAIANINNAYPWGWWTGFGIMTLIAFGGCGFTLALLVEVLGFHRFKPLVRPAIVMGLLFYLGYSVILMIELGRPWKAWMVFISWAPTSALFEIAWCAVLYTACLMVEVGHLAASSKGWVKIARLLGFVYLPIVVLGVTLSHLHQSSLGTLLTIVPLKVDPRWWSELLPATFLISAYIAGLSIVSIEHVVATRYLRLKPRVDLLAGLATIQVGLVTLFLALRIGDLIFRDVTDAMLELSWLSFALWLELVGFFLVPLVLFAIPDIRRTLWGSFTGSCLLALGVLSLRLNVSVVSMRVKHWETYFPSMGEFATGFGLVAGAILIYVALVRILPIHREEPLDPEGTEPVAPMREAEATS